MRPVVLLHDTFGPRFSFDSVIPKYRGINGRLNNQCPGLVVAKLTDLPFCLFFAEQGVVPNFSTLVLFAQICSKKVCSPNLC